MRNILTLFLVGVLCVACISQYKNTDATEKFKTLIDARQKQLNEI